jgi:uncharacterized protein YndB with AHSA1/START domain
MIPQFEKTVVIHSSTANVWNTLTDTTLMKQWMGDEEMQIEIQTDWKINSRIVISGFHHLQFENKGIVLQFEPSKILQYTHLSSLSRLEDKPENYSTIKFELKPVENQTALTVTIENFPTEAIYKHLYFYWRTTIEKMKIFSEQQAELVN